MKKTVAIILVLVMALSLAGCSEEAKLYEKYADIINSLEMKDYLAAMGQISIMAAQEQSANTNRPAPVTVMCDEWYLTDSYNEKAPNQIVLRQDNTCSVDGKDMIWLEFHSNDNNVSFAIMDGGEYVYYCGFSMDPEDLRMPSLNVSVAKVEGENVYGDKSLGEYRNHSQAKLPIQSWELLDGTDGMSENLHIYNYDMRYRDVSYNWKITSPEGETPLVLEALASDDSGKTLTISLEERDGHTVMTVTDGETEGSGLYVCEAYGFEQTWPEYLYPQVMNKLNRYLRDGYFWVDGIDGSLSENNARKYLNEQFALLGDYKDSAEYLARFSMVPSMLTSVVQNTTDQLGNVSDNRLERYVYDAQGRMVTGYGSKMMDTYGVYESWDDFHFEYDAAGKISQITLGGSSVSGVCVPEYDAAGNMVALNVQRTNGQYVTTFTYDAQGRLTGMDIPADDSDYYHYIYTYTYDDAGRLIECSKSWDKEYYKWVYQYTYEGDAVTQILETYFQRSQEKHTVTKVFTNDAQGRPVSAVVTTTDPNSTYSARELVYNYEDLYFMDTTGLEVPED